mgnify:CR=1 FL=1
MSTWLGKRLPEILMAYIYFFPKKIHVFPMLGKSSIFFPVLSIFFPSELSDLSPINPPLSETLLSFTDESLKLRLRSSSKSGPGRPSFAGWALQHNKNFPRKFKNFLW